MTRSELEQLHPTLSLCEPASPAQLLNVEQQLGLSLPDELKQLLAISDGLRIDDEENFHFQTLLYSIQQIREETEHFRLWWEEEQQLPLPFDRRELILIADDGAGNYLAMRPQSGGKVATLLKLDHETGQAEPLPPQSLRDYLQALAASSEDDFEG